MADDKKNPDEYEPSSEDYYKGEDYRLSEDSIESLEPETTRKRSFLSKRIYVIILVFLAIGLVYLILAYNNSQKASLASATPTVENETASIPPTTNNTFQATQAIPQTATPAAPTPDMSAIQNMSAANQQSIASLQSQIQQLQGQISDISNSISTLNSQLQVMANEIRAIGLGKQLQGREMELAPTTGTVYQLKAIIPGRAWLQAKDGTITTATIGDRLPGYGIIQMINAQQGVVATSSGAIIQYGPKDS